MGKTILVAARKGGVGKTTTSVNFGIGLSRKGHKVLLIDADSQHSLTASLGVREPEKLTVTLASVISEIIGEREINTKAGIINHSEGVDFLPSNSTLTGIELQLAPLISRESILRQYIDKVKQEYSYVIIDTAPTLDLLTINTLAAADSVIIPVCPKYLDALGLEQLLKAVAQIRRQINPTLAVEGIPELKTITRYRRVQAGRLKADTYGYICKDRVIGTRKGTLRLICRKLAKLTAMCSISSCKSAEKRSSNL